jgi:hypothetical protein
MWQYSNKGKLKITFTYRVNNDLSENIPKSDYVIFLLIKENSHTLTKHSFE